MAPASFAVSMLCGVLQDGLICAENLAFVATCECAASQPVLPENQKLLNALKVFKIAASDTCEYLIRAGRVEVNGLQLL